MEGLRLIEVRDNRRQSKCEMCLVSHKEKMVMEFFVLRFRRSISYKSRRQHSSVIVFNFGEKTIHWVVCQCYFHRKRWYQQNAIIESMLHTFSKLTEIVSEMQKCPFCLLLFSSHTECIIDTIVWTSYFDSCFQIKYIIVVLNFLVMQLPPKWKSWF